MILLIIVEILILAFIVSITWYIANKYYKNRPIKGPTDQNMGQYLIPVDNELIEEVAKSIARDRLHRDAIDTLKNAVGSNYQIPDFFEEKIDNIFENLWSNSAAADERQKDSYRLDAKAAINAINLKLLMSD